MSPSPPGRGRRANVQGRALPTDPAGGTNGGRIELTFEPPAENGGAPIVDFGGQCRPLFGGEIFAVDSSTSPITITGLPTGTDYDCLVLARNRVGAGEAVHAAVTIPGRGTPGEPGTPSPPRNVQGKALPLERGASLVDGGRVELSFDPPADNGGARITGFVAQCSPNDGSAPSVSVDGSSSPIVVNGLRTRTVHGCLVVARNAAGLGAVGIVDVSVPGADRPGPPRNVQGRALPADSAGGANSGRVELSFDPPAENGGTPIVDFGGQCRPLSGSEIFAVNGASSPITITGLPTGTDYDCLVLARNAVGAGEAVHVEVTIPGRGTPETPGTPSPPRDVRGKALPLLAGASLVDGGRVELSFETPADDGGARVTSFVAQCSPNDGSTRPVSVEQSSSPIVVTGLRTRTVHGCLVVARNAAGLGDVGIVDVNVPGADRPGPPRNVQGQSLAADPAGGSNGGRIELRFDPPAENGGTPVVNFGGQCRPSLGSEIFAADSTSSPITLVNLPTGVDYDCLVLARNAVGAGEAVHVEVTVPQPRGPSEPRNVQARALPLTTESASTGRVEVSFDRPERTGGSDIVAFRVDCTQSNPSGPGAPASRQALASPITVSGVAVGAEYVCAVVAINQTGLESPAALSGPVTVRRPSAPPAPKPAGAPPTAPREVEARALPLGPNDGGMQGSVEVGFVEPESDGGAALTAFTARCTLHVGGAEIAELVATGSGSSSPVPVTGLQTDFPYTCSVSATNAAGLEGPAATATKPVTVLGRPGPPSDVRAKALPLGSAGPREGSVEVSFTPPAEKGAPPVTQFAVRCTTLLPPPRAGDSPLELSASAFGTSSPVTVTGLVVDFRYECSVAAVNRIGEGQGIRADLGVGSGQPCRGGRRPGEAAAPASR